MGCDSDSAYRISLRHAFRGYCVVPQFPTYVNLNLEPARHTSHDINKCKVIHQATTNWYFLRSMVFSSSSHSLLCHNSDRYSDTFRCPIWVQLASNERFQDPIPSFSPWDVNKLDSFMHFRCICLFEGD